MCDDDIDPGFADDAAVSRRAFSLMTVAAAGVATTAAHAAVAVVEKDVTIKTADGNADAALFYPQGKGSWPAVIMWPDIMTLRPAFREMGKRLAGEGYVVLVPNFYYRTQKAPIALNYSNPEDRAKFGPMRAALTDEAVDRDAIAFVAFLDAQPQTDKRRKIGVQGYCMGGPLSFRTAAASARIGAVSSFHGGGLVTTAANSPHLLVPKTKADYLICVAQNDDAREPAAKDALTAAFQAAKLPHKVEVYAADHGWMVKGSQVYNEAEAERGWREMVAQYKRALR